MSHDAYAGTADHQPQSSLSPSSDQDHPRRLTATAATTAARRVPSAALSPSTSAAPDRSLRNNSSSRQASSSSSQPWYISQTTNYLNNPTFDRSAFRFCPPAGNTVYPLSENVTQTHWLYNLPPLVRPGITDPASIQTVNLSDLVGGPGLSEGIQIGPLNDPLAVEEDHWVRPCDFDHGRPTWEVAQDHWRIHVRSIRQHDGPVPPRPPVILPSQPQSPTESVPVLSRFHSAALSATYPYPLPVPALGSSSFRSTVRPAAASSGSASAATSTTLSPLSVVTAATTTSANSDSVVASFSSEPVSAVAPTTVTTPNSEPAVTSIPSEPLLPSPASSTSTAAANTGPKRKAPPNPAARAIPAPHPAATTGKSTSSGLVATLASSESYIVPAVTAAARTSPEPVSASAEEPRSNLHTPSSQAAQAKFPATTSVANTSPELVSTKTTEQRRESLTAGTEATSTPASTTVLTHSGPLLAASGLTTPASGVKTARRSRNLPALATPVTAPTRPINQESILSPSPRESRSAPTTTVRTRQQHKNLLTAAARTRQQHKNLLASASPANTYSQPVTTSALTKLQFPPTAEARTRSKRKRPSISTDKSSDSNDSPNKNPPSPSVFRRRSPRKKRQTRLPERFRQDFVRTAAMPSAQTKRVKNKRVERPFIIGSEAWPLDETGTRKPDTPAEHTKGWRVYVKTPPGQPDITTWLKKVAFKIFHTYPNPTRTVEEPPFQIEETGWGGFTVEVKLTFVPEVNGRTQDRSHFLQLEPYGDETEQEKQKREKLVRSEFLDYVEFNEPTEPMWDILTSESQFKSGKGKGKGKKVKREDDEDANETVQLPETSSPDNPYSKELEHQLLEILKKAEGQVDELLKVDAEKAKSIEEQLKELRPAET